MDMAPSSRAGGGGTSAALGLALHGRGGGVAMVTLLHGDCLELLPTLANGSVSMVFADLPYAHMSGGKVRKCTANKWDTPIDLAKLWEQLLRVGKRNAAFVFTTNDGLLRRLEKTAPIPWRYNVVWVRKNPTGFLLAKKRPLTTHEMIGVFYRAQPTFNPQMTFGHRPYRKTATDTCAGTMYGNSRLVTRAAVNDGSRYPTSVLEIGENDLRGSWGNSKRLHPTQKPVALLEWLIRTYSNPGDTVLDPTAGSFTTGVACVQTGRSFIGIERDAGYFEIGKRRVEAAQPPLPGAA